MNFSTNLVKKEQNSIWTFSIICQEFRFQIDEHRERLKEKIDDVALEMIEQTKKCEAEYLKSLKENLLSSFDESKSLDRRVRRNRRILPKSEFINSVN